MNQIAIFCIRFISTFLKALSWRACRFAPSCSEYSVGAFKRFSWLKAFFLSMGRVGRCHPLCHGGYDPLPDK